MGVNSHIGGKGLLTLAIGAGAVVAAGWTSGTAWADDNSHAPGSSGTGVGIHSATTKSGAAGKNLARSPNGSPTTLRVRVNANRVERPAPDRPAATIDVPQPMSVIPKAAGSSRREMAANGVSPGTPQTPPETTQAPWSLLPSSRRESGAASIVVAAQTPRNSLTLTAPPSLGDQISVFAARMVRVVSDLVGVNLYVKLGELMSSDSPPFFLNLGLTVARTQYEVSPGNSWEAWEFTPPEPSGKTVIAIHGGGWTIQPTLLHWIDYTSMARATGATVIVPMYPLATTEAGSAVNVIPGMASVITDIIDEHGAENVSIYADSAGPTIALGAVRQLIQEGNDIPASMVLLSFSPDLSSSNPAIKTTDDPIFDSQHPRDFDTGHWEDGLDPKDPMISSLYFEDDVLKALPPTTIYIGSLEMMLPDNLLLYQRAVEEGAPISMVIGQGQMHDWAMAGDLPVPINSQSAIVRPDIYRQLGLTGVLEALPRAPR